MFLEGESRKPGEGTFLLGYIVPLLSAVGLASGAYVWWSTVRDLHIQHTTTVFT